MHAFIYFNEYLVIACSVPGLVGKYSRGTVQSSCCHGAGEGESGCQEAQPGKYLSG